MIEYVTPAVNEYVALAPAVTYTAPCPVIEYVAATLVGTFDKSARVDEEQQHCRSDDASNFERYSRGLRIGPV